LWFIWTKWPAPQQPTGTPPEEVREPAGQAHGGTGARRRVRGTGRGLARMEGAMNREGGGEGGGGGDETLGTNEAPQEGLELPKPPGKIGKKKLKKLQEKEMKAKLREQQQYERTKLKAKEEKEYQDHQKKKQRKNCLKNN